MKKLSLRAFTLIELLVVISIFTFISILILANNSRFNSSVLLGSLAYDIALSVRQAQVYGVSVQAYNATFQSGYGIHFSTNPGTSYLLFADTGDGAGGPPDNRYEDSTFQFPDGALKTYSVGQGHTVQSVCGITPGGQSNCAITSLDVVFHRPNPDANITSGGISYPNATVTVASPSKETRTIHIDSTGQISVTNP